MKTNIILHYSIFQKLLQKNEKAIAFFQQIEKTCHLWIPIVYLPLIEQNYPTAKVNVWLENINILSAAGMTNKEISIKENYADTILNNSASSLPGDTYIWSVEKISTLSFAHGDAEWISAQDAKKCKAISFIDLPEQQIKIRNQVEKCYFNLLHHGRYIMGQEIEDFEQALAEFIDVKHVLACGSGTDALLMALMAYDIGPGDAILTTPFTFVATAEVIAILGATPVFVDIDPQTYNIDPVKLQQVITSEKDKYHFKGIIAVDLFGLPAEYEALQTIADSNNLFIIEDSAQGLGGNYHGKLAGSFGDIAATSFFPAKPLAGYGDAGAVLTNSDELYDRLFSIRMHGQGKDRYDNVVVGLNARCDTLQAAILSEKLKLFKNEIEARNQLAEQYTEQLNEAIITPYIPKGLTSVWAQYSIQSEKRDHIRAALQKQDIPSAIYYPQSLHLQPVFSYLGYQLGDMPISEKIGARIFSLPMNPYLSSEEISKICTIINQALTTV